MQTTGTFDIVIQMPSNTENKASAGTPAQPMQENEPVNQDPVRGGGGGSGGGVSMGATIAAGVALNVAKQAASTAISNIGLALGDSFKQRQIERTVTIGSKLVGFGIAIASQNYAAAVSMLASEAIQFSSEAWRLEKQREIANYSAEQYARKIGYTNARK